MKKLRSSPLTNTLRVVHVCLSPDLLQRKSEHGRLQAAADLDRQQTMELEEAVRDTVKSRGVPKEVFVVFVLYTLEALINGHIGTSFSVLY